MVNFSIRNNVVVRNGRKKCERPKINYLYCTLQYKTTNKIFLVQNIVYKRKGIVCFFEFLLDEIMLGILPFGA